MESSPEQQVMSRRILEALTAIQGDTTNSVPIHDIMKYVVNLMQHKDIPNAAMHFMKALNTLKEMGLVRETRNAEFALYRYPTSTRLETIMVQTSKGGKTVTKRSSQSIAKRKSGVRIKKAMVNASNMADVVCISCRSALAKFLESYNAAKDGGSLQVNFRVSYMNNNTKPTEETQSDSDADANTTTGRNFQFNNPEPINLPDDNQSSAT